MNRRDFLSLTAASLAAMSLKANEVSSEPTQGNEPLLASSMLFEPSFMSTSYLVDPRAIPHTILLNDESPFWKNTEKYFGVKSDWGGFPIPKLIFWRGDNIPADKRYQSVYYVNDENCREMSNPRIPPKDSHIRKVIKPKPYTIKDLRENNYTHVMLDWITPPNKANDELDVMLVTLLDLASHTSEQHMPAPVWGTRKQSQSLVSRMHDADYYLYRKGYPTSRQLLTHPSNIKKVVDTFLRCQEVNDKLNQAFAEYAMKPHLAGGIWIVPQGPEVAGRVEKYKVERKNAQTYAYTSKACPKNVAYLTASKEWLGPFQQSENGQIIMAVLNDTAVTKIEL